MRRTGKAAVVAAVVLGALGFGGAGVAHAEGLPVLEVTVELDRTAPSTGELVRGVRSIEGQAEAPEGISRVDLYVVEHSLTRSVAGSVPVDSYTPSVPLGRAEFDFAWDSAKTPAGLVDVIVVATSTTTRTAEARVVSVRVQHVASQPAKPVVKQAAPRKSSVKATSTATTRRASRAAAAPAAVQRKQVAARIALAPNVQAAQTAQAEAFYAALSAGDEPSVEATSAPVAKASAIAPLARATRGPWPSVAVGLILLVAAGHVQRAVRVQLA